MVGTSAWGVTAIVDLTADIVRAGDLRGLSPNANLIHPNTMVPCLDVTLDAGTHTLARAPSVPRPIPTGYSRARRPPAHC